MEGETAASNFVRRDRGLRYLLMKNWSHSSFSNHNFSDSTAEYIQAKKNNPDENGIEMGGLRCVCVLIGVYDLQTGIPVMGIINQPFYKESDNAPR